MPMANKLVNKMGETARKPLVMVSANALSVPRVSGAGDTSLSASCTAVKAMLTPGPRVSATLVRVQKATSAAYVPWAKIKLRSGIIMMKKGYAMPQARNTPLVPRRCCSGGKISISQRAWLRPIKPMNSEICRGEKPKPPSAGVVNQNTGTMAEYARPRSMALP